MPTLQHVWAWLNNHLAISIAAESPGDHQETQIRTIDHTIRCEIRRTVFRTDPPLREEETKVEPINDIVTIEILQTSDRPKGSIKIHILTVEVFIA